ncbi:Methyltransferase type 11 [Arcobacter nitrofigilis DSM 7299]|uniref:Methyltransferase type 11 n=1 Tax=Arcobacter nitrofigilis (strain ATCC 33309 / DSM 7299 / CCUG 15893 / LMG 7604 / NCTC 12251 / CI) TaxID=572480 RepID=D5V4R1_ARCNC|nr:class I SAM-dependent methyltransferase [Arcobacter nitrofigilis]ADG92966.1 Methyltransferase type 11 [Arcobacter nitrofigilis DSM 7299]
MQTFDPIEYKKMVKQYQEDNKPLDWFDTIYKNANGDYKKVFWADLEASPYLINWLKNNKINKQAPKAIVIGCGVGDDAEALSDFGFEVTAFDISPTAIELCKKRYPNTKVDYLVANLFEYDKSWLKNFDLVYECNTIQVLPGDYRIKARVAISNLLTIGGYVLVSCRSREENKNLTDIPLPLDKKEINQFVQSDGLEEISFLAYDDNQTPSVPHFFAVYKRVK